MESEAGHDEVDDELSKLPQHQPSSPCHTESGDYIIFVNNIEYSCMHNQSALRNVKISPLTEHSPNKPLTIQMFSSHSSL